MSVKRDPDAILAAWLEEGPARLPDATRRAIGVASRSTDQRRRPVRAPWRLPLMNTYAKLAATAVLVVVVGAAGLAVLGPGLPGVGGSVSPGASPTSMPTPANAPNATPSSAVTDTSHWVPFTSTRYAYTMSHPASWTATPADHNAAIIASPGTIPDSSADAFIDSSASYQILVTAFAESARGAASVDDWLDQYYKASTPEQQQCYKTIEMQPITIDGHVGRIATNDACGAAEAFVLFDGRIHAFGVWRGNQEPLFQAFLGTVRFTPAASASPLPTAVPFSSDLYGYTLTLPGGWSAAPARIKWDGKGAPPYDDPQVDRFAGSLTLSTFAFAGPTRLDLNRFTEDVVARNVQFHGDTCPPQPESIKSTMVGKTAAKFIAWNCGILINIVVVVDRGTGYEFVMRDTAVQAATDAADRTSFDAILSTVTFTR